MLRQLLAWERDLAGPAEGLFDDRIYVLTPQGSMLELPRGASQVHGPELLLSPSMSELLAPFTALSTLA